MTMFASAIAIIKSDRQGYDMTPPSPFVAHADAIALLPPADPDDAYENRKYIPAADEHMARWQQQSAAFRSNATHAVFDQAYGPAPRERYDLFWPDGGPRTEKGLLVIVHGGYWLAFSKDDFTHLARGAVEQGWAVAMISYTLAPEARIAEITDEMVSAVNTLAGIASGPMRLAGHSAGGHLVSRMMCMDTALSAAALARLDRIVSISGLHDLRALLPLEKNASWQLDAHEAAAESAICHQPRTGIELVCVAGGDERPEFIRQNGILPLVWQGLGARCHTQLLAKEDHFSIIAQMTDPDSQLSRLIDAPLG